MTLQEIIDETFEKMKMFKPQVLLPALRAADNDTYGGTIWDDVMNTNGCANYQFSTCLVDLLKPTQIVELGGAMGAWSVCILQTLSAESQLYSITVAEEGKEFMFVVDKYPNFHPIVGDDLNMDNWKGVDLAKTDIWYIDTIHTAEHLKKELELYTPFFKKGALVLFDDIRMNDMFSVWESLPYEKKELTDPCHHTGWGICRI